VGNNANIELGNNDGADTVASGGVHGAVHGHAGPPLSTVVSTVGNASTEK